MQSAPTAMLLLRSQNARKSVLPRRALPQDRRSSFIGGQQGFSLRIVFVFAVSALGCSITILEAATIDHQTCPHPGYKHAKTRAEADSVAACCPGWLHRLCVQNSCSSNMYSPWQLALRCEPVVLHRLWTFYIKMPLRRHDSTRTWAQYAFSRWNCKTREVLLPRTAPC